MRAIQHPKYGPPDVLRLTDLPRPTPRPHEVLVAVHASAVTHGDRRLRAADYPALTWLPGRLMTGVLRPRHPIPGTIFAGRVVEVGARVTRFAIGDDVFGLGLHGAHAEYVAVAADGAIARAPVGFDAAETAALPYGVTTALAFLRDRARVRPGERVAILGAAGEVGRAAVQVARHLGAEVTAVCRRDPDRVSGLGADHVVAADAPLPPHDVIFDATGESHFGRHRHALAPRGRYLTLDATLLGLAQMATTAIARGRRMIVGVAIPDARMLDDVRALAERGAVCPIIGHRFPLERVADAHAQLEAGARGSVVVMVQPALVAYSGRPAETAGRSAGLAAHSG